MRGNCFQRALILSCVVLGLWVSTVGVALAHLGRPAVWTDLERPVVCPLVYSPVHDVFGNTYDNFCIAVQHGVRVAWGGVAHDLP